MQRKPFSNRPARECFTVSLFENTFLLTSWTGTVLCVLGRAASYAIQMIWLAGVMLAVAPLPIGAFRCREILSLLEYISFDGFFSSALFLLDDSVDGRVKQTLNTFSISHGCLGLNVVWFYWHSLLHSLKCMDHRRHVFVCRMQRIEKKRSWKYLAWIHFMFSMSGMLSNGSV